MLKKIPKSHRILFFGITILVGLALLLMFVLNWHLRKLLNNQTHVLEGIYGVIPIRDTALLQRQHLKLQLHISDKRKIFSAKEYQLQRDLLSSRLSIMNSPLSQKNLGPKGVKLLEDYEKAWVNLQPKLDLWNEDSQNNVLQKDILHQLNNMEIGLLDVFTQGTHFWRGNRKSQQAAINRIYQLLQTIFFVVIFLSVAGILLLRRTFAERRRDLAHIHHLANFDVLTDLPNRHSLTEKLKQQLFTAERYGSSVAFMFLDLDRFKIVNDTLGHDAGDKLLIAVAKRLSKCIRKSDILARLGGDEFAVILPYTKATQAYKVAERMITELKSSFQIDNLPVQVGVSIGISEYPRTGQDVKSLMKQADVAMYKAKGRNQRGAYCLFSEEDNASLSERIQIEADMQNAISQNEFALYYQPRFDLATGRISCFEALIRWRHPERGLVPPGIFIPIAETSGFIHTIGTWVINAACAQIEQWQQQGIKVRVSANLSIQELERGNLVEQVQDALSKHNVEPSCLELEVTEHVAMSNVKITLQTLNRLRNLGIQLSIDDFGSGHSSLNYLKRLPVDILKIDRSFLNEIKGVDDFHSKDANIINSVISLAHSLSLSTVVEGVETQHQLDLLNKLKPEEAQGYFLGRPLPVNETTALLMQNVNDTNNLHLATASQ